MLVVIIFCPKPHNVIEVEIRNFSIKKVGITVCITDKVVVILDDIKPTTVLMMIGLFRYNFLAYTVGILVRFISFITFMLDLDTKNVATDENLNVR